MKKHRPSKATTAAKRARKAAQCAAAIPASHQASQPSTGDAWQWHATSAGAGPKAAPGKRRKGPPPRVGSPSVPPSGPTGPSPLQPRSKLAPALAARLTGPLPPAVREAPRSTRWRADWTAAAAIFLPAIVALLMLMVTPRLLGPHDRDALAAAVHLREAPRWVAAPTAPQPSTTHNVSRPLQPLAEPDPHAEAALASAVAALVTQIAQGHPPASIPAEPSAVAVARLPADRDQSRPMEPIAEPDPLADAQLASAVAAFAIELAFALPPAAAPDAPAIVAALPHPPIATAPDDSAATSAPPAAANNVCSAATDLVPAGRVRGPLAPLHPDETLAADPRRFGLALAAAAEAETHSLVVYKADYMTIAYPRGDVPAMFGVCTDVVIRAYRALDIDLQELVHQTRAAGPSDRNIDHRRTDLLRRFFATHGEALAITPYVEDYLPGDIVTYYRPQNKSSTAHIAVVSTEFAPTGRPLIVHNRGWGVQLEDALFVDQITGHYRFRGQPPGQTNIAVAKPTAPVAARLAGSLSPAPRALLRTALARLPRGPPDQPPVAGQPLEPPMGLGVRPKVLAAPLH